MVPAQAHIPGAGIFTAAIRKKWSLGGSRNFPDGGCFVVRRQLIPIRSRNRNDNSAKRKIKFRRWENKIPFALSLSKGCTRRPSTGSRRTEFYFPIGGILFSGWRNYHFCFYCELELLHSADQSFHWSRQRATRDMGLRCAQSVAHQF